MIKKQNSTFDDSNPNLCKLHIIITNSYKTIFTWKYSFVMQVNPFDCGWPLMLPMHQISSWLGFVSLVKQKRKDKLLMRLRLGNHVFQPKWWSFPKTNQVAWLSKPNQTLSWNEMWKYQKQHESGKTKIMISCWHHLLQFCAMTSQVNLLRGNLSVFWIVRSFVLREIEPHKKKKKYNPVYRCVLKAVLLCRKYVSLKI